ncbi:MAG: hypothetical protein HFI72_04910 [Peptococcaceae bacterium]|nr:hypothetical protein [Peptococcaceae bacterium]
MFKNLFKKEAPVPAGYDFPITLHLNARFQPKHRHELEDALEEIFSQRGLGEVTGGGTLQLPSGEIKSCDIELCLKDDQPETIEAITHILDKIGIAKGSKLIWQTTEDTDREQPVGRLEGLALYLNGTDLPKEVYQTCDINQLIEQIENLLDTNGSLYSWWEGPEQTALYFYGASYGAMLAAIEQLLQEHPLCEKCITNQIA